MTKPDYIPAVEKSRSVCTSASCQRVSLVPPVGFPKRRGQSCPRQGQGEAVASFCKGKGC
eukprot:5105676-Amphidinium_carterae.1